MAAADVNPHMTGYLNDLDSPEPPSRNPNTVASAPARDDLDDLFSYDVDERELFGVNEPAVNPPARPSNTQATAGSAGRAGATGLGIDEEVKVQKKRARVKLDEERLLSERGISKLRKLSKSRLKFKGKGHELSDAQRLLIFYQLWLDDLFPKAKFADGLAIIEKLGHKKRMTTMRREWIDEEKPKHDVLSDEDDFRQQATKSGDNQNQETVARPQTPSRPNVVADDLYGVSPQAVPSNPISKSREKQDLGLFLSDGEDGPEEDELDALLAEDTEVQASAALQSSVLPLSKPVDDYDDEFEAMGGIGDPW